MYEKVVTGPKRNIESLDLLRVLSKDDNFKLFVAAKNGARYSPFLLNKLGLSRKRYYKALCDLANHGLIHKRGDGRNYFHTTFGEILYRRIIIDVDRYISHVEELRMIDTLKLSGEFGQDEIARFLEKVSDEDKMVRNIFGTFEIVWSYYEMVKVLLEQLRECNKEVLVATRLLSEEVIQALLVKATQGINVQILSDTSLVESYFVMQNLSPDSSNNIYDRPERIDVVGNPWHPDNRVNRRITKVPFGMIIIDESKVGMELVDAHNPKEFTGGILIQDNNIAVMMKDYYQKLWTQASEFKNFYRDHSIA